MSGFNQPCSKQDIGKTIGFWCFRKPSSGSHTSPASPPQVPNRPTQRIVQSMSALWVLPGRTALVWLPQRKGMRSGFILGCWLLFLGLRLAKPEPTPALPIFETLKQNRLRKRRTHNFEEPGEHLAFQIAALPANASASSALYWKICCTARTSKLTACTMSVLDPRQDYNLVQNNLESVASIVVQDLATK